MHVIVCIDDRGGMLFNGRRQSHDRAVRMDILATARGHILRMNAYSRRQFPEPELPILVDEDFFAKAGPGEFCFVETLPVFPVSDQIEQLIVYHWNCVYPADLLLGFSPAEKRFSLSFSAEFPGFSHKIITKEVYTR